MTHADQITALLPQLLSSLLVVVLLGLVALRRCHATTALVTIAGLALTLASVPFAAGAGPQDATALFRIDGQALFFAALVLAGAIGAALLMWAYLDDFAGNREEMYLLLALSVNGALMLVCARHLASFFIGLELMSVPLYGMLGYLFVRRSSLESATKYLVLSAAATAFMLFGMALLYAQSGRLDFAGIAAQFGTGHGIDAWLAQAGLALVLAGVAFKLSLAPFHAWTLDVYQGAPAPVAAYLATVGKVAVVAVLLRLLQDGGVYEVAGTDPLLGAGAFYNLLSAVAVLSILAGNLLALRQQELKRLLAASSIAHFGYLLVALVAAGSFATEAAGMYLAAYVATSLGAFGVISALSRAGADLDVSTSGNLRGLARRSPFLALTLALMLLSLAGMPLTAGFIGKFYVVAAGAAAGLWWLLGLVVAGSAIGLAYYLRVVAVLFAREDVPPAPLRIPPAALVAVAGALAAVLFVGTWPQPLATLLVGAAPAHIVP